MAIVLHCELYSSKNSRQVFRTKDGRTIVAKSKNAKAQEEEFATLLMINRPEWFRMIEGKTLPLKVHFKIYRRTHGRFDYVNIVQGLLDAMVKADYLKDDNADIIIPVFEPYEVDKEKPRVIIDIE